MTEELLKELLKEEEYAFSGWDFSHLEGRIINESLPWSYYEYVKKHLQKDSILLDIGTGGGEFLLSLNHVYDLTSVTEAYSPNIALCLKKLLPLGITVYPVTDDDLLTNVPADYFDVVINRHESFLPSEINRVLKSNGVFITEQVGAYNNKDIATFFDEKHQDQFPSNTLEKNVLLLKDNGFDIIYQNECYPKCKYLDLGALVFLAKIIKWEFIDFNVKDNIQKLDILNEQINKQGFVEATEHRFMIIAKKSRSNAQTERKSNGKE